MRKNRKLREGAEYHVTARINRGESIFESDESKELFLDVVKRAKRKYRFQIRNFCVMGNHIHLMLKPGKNESLSRIMQWILGVFAMLWNRRRQVTGHLWGDRFFSRIITGVLDLLRVFLYIDNNPVDAQLIDHPWGWKYGGLWHHRMGIRDITDKPDLIIRTFFPEHERI
ncbi:MAG: transposase [Treponema sp.]|jgi:putative transposase|nr:transposase [Treponema sp.]